MWVSGAIKLVLGRLSDGWLKKCPLNDGELQKTYFLNDGEFMKVSYENDGEKIFAKRRTTYSPG